MEKYILSSLHKTHSRLLRDELLQCFLGESARATQITSPRHVTFAGNDEAVADAQEEAICRTGLVDCAVDYTLISASYYDLESAVYCDPIVIVSQPSVDRNAGLQFSCVPSCRQMPRNSVMFLMFTCLT